VERQPGSGEISVHDVAVDAAAFVRVEQFPKLAQAPMLKPLQRWLVYSEQLRKDPALLAYYTFEGAKQGNLQRLPNVSSLGGALDGQIEGTEWVDGRLPGKYALYFRGPDSGDRVVLPEQDRFNFTGPFSVAVWFKVDRRPASAYQILVLKGENTWRFQRYETCNNFALFTDRLGHKDGEYSTAIGQTDVDDGRWHLGVAIYEPSGNVANLRLYMDGRMEGEAKTPVPLNRNDSPVSLAGGVVETTWDRTFCGWIDEVAILTRALSSNEVAEMFNAGNPLRLLPAKSNMSK
jgi:hypothetical protein